MDNSAFWRALAERVLSTFAQTLLGVLGALVAPHVMRGEGLDTVPWVPYLSVALLAAGLAIVKGIAAALKDGNPSIGSVEVLAVPGATADPVAAGPVEVVPDSQPRRSLED